MRSKSIILPVSLILASMLLLTACAGSNAQAAGGTTAVISSVTASDTIQTSGTLGADQLSGMSWGTSGTVGAVNVKVGQSVRAGDVLAILTQDSVPSTIITAQANLSTAQSDLQNLLDSKAAQAAAQAAVANAEQTVKTAQAALDSANHPRATQALLDSVQTNIDNAKSTLNRAIKSQRVIDRTKGVLKATTADLTVATDRLNLSSLIATYNWYTGKPNPADLDLLRANLAVAQASLADAQRAWQAVQNGPDPIAVAAAQARVTAAQAVVNSMAIIAPFDGRVLTIQTSPGIAVNKGDAAVQLFNPGTLKVDTLVDETAISDLAVGNSADVTMDMLPGVILMGKVSMISSIGSTVNGLVKYKVTVALDPTSQPVRFGATANVTLHTGQPHSILAIPPAAIQSDSAGEYILLLNSDGTSARVAVTSAGTSGGLMTFTTKSSGLKAGDQVLLPTPASN